MSCYNNTSCTAGGDTGWCSWRDECIPVKRTCQLIVSISRDAGRLEGWSVWLVMNMYWQQASSRGSVWSGIYMDIYSAWGRLAGWLAGRQAGGWAGRQTDGRAGGDGGVEQGEFSLEVCVNVTAGWKKAADTQSGAVSRLADCTIRAGWVEKMESRRKFVLFVCVTNRERERCRVSGSVSSVGKINAV